MNDASASPGNALVRKILPDGTLATVIGGLNGGVRLAIDARNNLYLTDGLFVRKISQDGTTSLIAGNGSSTSSGDEGPATSAGLGSPSAIAVDNSGNMYIATNEYVVEDDDVEHGRVRIVTPDGIIHAFAGTGVDGYSGDGGSAVSAQISAWLPEIVADAAGDVFIVDALSHTIRKVTPDGKIASLITVDESGCYLQGVGPYICAGDLALDASSQMYIVGEYNPVIQRLGADGSLTTIAGGGQPQIGDGGMATSALLAGPLGVAVDSGHNVYIGDAQNNRIRKVAPNGTITTVAGNGQARLPGDPVTDGVPALSVPLACAAALSCKGIATDAAGNLYFSDNDRVRKVSPAGMITTVAKVVAHGLVSDGTNIYVAAPFADQILKIAPDGTQRVVAGTGVYGHAGDGGPGNAAQLYVPTDVAVDGSGNVYIAENYVANPQSDAGRVPSRRSLAAGARKAPTGARRLGESWPEPGDCRRQRGNLYVAEYDSGQIRSITPDGLISTIAGCICQLGPASSCAGYSGDGGPATAAQFRGRRGMVVRSRRRDLCQRQREQRHSRDPSGAIDPPTVCDWEAEAAAFPFRGPPWTRRARGWPPKCSQTGVRKISRNSCA